MHQEKLYIPYSSDKTRELWFLVHLTSISFISHIVQIKHFFLDFFVKFHYFLYIPYSSDKTNHLKKQINYLFKLYIPYSSDKTPLTKFIPERQYFFISHIVQIKLKDNRTLGYEEGSIFISHIVQIKQTCLPKWYQTLKTLYPI